MFRLKNIRMFILEHTESNTRLKNIRMFILEHTESNTTSAAALGEGGQEATGVRGGEEPECCDHAAQHEGDGGVGQCHDRVL